MTAASEPTIRYATQEDVPTILALIKELAEYENASTSVQATEATLSQTLSFAPSRSLEAKPQGPGYAKTLLIFSPNDDGGDTIAGMALFFHNYSTWRAAPGIYLEDLFIRPPFRRRGYATVLLRRLAKEVKAIEGGRLEWACLKWNESALKFYKGLGAMEMEEWVGLRVEGKALEALAGDAQHDGKGSSA